MTDCTGCQDSTVLKLHNDVVLVNDPVFDTKRGCGRVARIDKDRDRIYVVFESTKTAEFSYSKDGTMAGALTPTLFWHPPVMYSPPKDAALWHKVHASLQQLIKTWGA